MQATAVAALTLTFSQFLPQTAPSTWRFDWKHSVYLQSILEKVTSGAIKRLIVSMPPRHTKSETITVRYGVYRLERRKDLRVIIGAHTQQLADKFGRKGRRIAQRRFALADDRSAVSDWQTPEGGGIRAVGVGGPIAGEGGDLIILDDPIKNREQAESKIYRDKIWEWFTDDIYTRLEPGGAVIIIMTRWHEDDLVGRILASENAAEWTVVNLPAIAEEGDELGRKPGEALCPDRYDVPALDDIRKTQGEYAFNALYQGRPSAREGTLFLVSRLQFVDRSEVPLGLPAYRGWDLAATEDDGDYSAGTKIEGPDENGIYYIEALRFRHEPAQRNKLILQTARQDGVKVRISVPKDPGAGGKEAAMTLVKLLAGFRVSKTPETGDKYVRMEPLAAQVNEGNCRIVRNKHASEFKEELRQVPSGTNDDMADAAARAFNCLTGKNVARVLGKKKPEENA